ncbi:hypothetical protein GQ457_06G022490 [Hibiscus cannabinus]
MVANDQDRTLEQNKELERGASNKKNKIQLIGKKKQLDSESSGKREDETTQNMKKRVVGILNEEMLWQLEKSLVSTMASECSVESVRERLHRWGLGDVKLLKDKNWSLFEEVSTKVELWRQSWKNDERTTWVEIRGTPLFCWNFETFSRIVGKQGKLIALGVKGNMLHDGERVTVLVSSKQLIRIEEEVKMEVGNDDFNVWIYEIPFCSVELIEEVGSENENVTGSDVNSLGNKKKDVGSLNAGVLYEESEMSEGKKVSGNSNSLNFESSTPSSVEVTKKNLGPLEDAVANLISQDLENMGLGTPLDSAELNILDKLDQDNVEPNSIDGSNKKRHINEVEKGLSSKDDRQTESEEADPDSTEIRSRVQQKKKERAKIKRRLKKKDKAKEKVQIEGHSLTDSDLQNRRRILINEAKKMLEEGSKSIKISITESGEMKLLSWNIRGMGSKIKMRATIKLIVKTR